MKTKLVKPLDAGLDSSPSMVGQRFAKVINALEEINGNVIEEGEVTAMVRKLKHDLIEILIKEDWQVHYSKPKQKMLVFKPKD